MMKGIIPHFWREMWSQAGRRDRGLPMM